jgi:pSer/pThr/pTyr-binding forkhead associated (FHA) protein
MMTMRAQLQYFDGHIHQVMPLNGSITIGGRHSAIRVNGSTVTRQYARIFEEGGRFWIEDLGGDGVRVNGAKVDRTVLTNHDRLQVGSLQLQYFEG